MSERNGCGGDEIILMTARIVIPICALIEEQMVVVVDIIIT
jgi:hypothetical protein